MHNSAGSRAKQGLFCTADVTDDEVTDHHHGHYLVGVTLLFLCLTCMMLCFMMALKRLLLLLPTTSVVQVEQSVQCLCVCVIGQ